MPPDVPSPPPDAERFEAAYAAHRDDLLRYALRRTGHPDEAADTVADTFLIAWQRIDALPPGDQGLPWLYGVARNVLANRGRGTRRRTRLAERLRAETAGTTVTPPAGADLVDIGRVFRTLPETDRELLSLAGWEELEAAEIAVVLGISRNAARIRLHRARKRFRRALHAAGLASAPETPEEPLTAVRAYGLGGTR
ncbi:RNA polymerase sigma factor [Nocardiopsis potens]|uniref:RNA polymerase sigma factor n=1 Tax=Nocardiopsis potens TaxID=1246458 RepID=UPI0003492F3D|nr:sigma-70 family RNA polymerase sigma factor [Nocardiopsis potens]